MWPPASGREAPVCAHFHCTELRERYCAKILQCQHLLRQGEAYEICLTTRFREEARSEAPGHRSDDPPDQARAAGRRLDPLRDTVGLYLQLRAANPAPFAALLRWGGHMGVCSSSPERFLRVRRHPSGGLGLQSRPIKGTRGRGQTPEEDAALMDDLRHSAKDRRENLMIVDLVRNDLGRVCRPASVCVPELFKIETYASVHQMVSTIEGRLKEGLGALDAVRAAFPMGSMTGAPKRRVLEFIDQLEVPQSPPSPPLSPSSPPSPIDNREEP